MSTAKQLNEVIALLVARFPNTFAMFQERRKPLKLGIHHDLAAALGEVEHLNAALAYYRTASATLRRKRLARSGSTSRVTRLAASAKSKH